MVRSDIFPVIAAGDPWHDSAYAVHDGSRLRHVEVERFTRHKYEDVNPLLYGSLAEPDTFASAATFLFEEGRFLAPLARALASGKAVRLEAEARRLIATQAGSLATSGEALERAIANLVAIFGSIRAGRAAVEIYDHHFAHAAHAFVGSPFETATVITLDGGGTHRVRGKPVDVHGSVYRFERGLPLNRQAECLVTDWSPGWAWTRASILLGMGINDAGTVMAMAAYGKPDPEIAVLVRDKRFWNVATANLSLFRQNRESRLRKQLAAILAKEERRFAFARELQEETERRLRDFMRPFLESGEVDLCLAGGTFLNCIVAGKVRQWFPAVRRVYIPAVPYDAGLSLGMVQAFLHDRGDASIHPGSDAFEQFALGNRYSLVDVVAACRSHGCAEPVRQGLDAVAADIAAGKIVALFQGSSESGRRALGNRSILCDPRDAANKDRLNRVIKKRQWFRPFAPMILAEKIDDWFEAETDFASPYMGFAAQFRDGKGEQVPAVRHADGSARVQTVHSSLTPKTHALLEAWDKLTGIPILLNTSFNDNEPIVETPSQAVATMLRSGIDQLHFADYGLTVFNPAAAAD
jgi:carbamoyltransferase